MKNNKNDDIREKFISKVEVVNACNKLKNIQDKILIYAVYNGIKGEKLQELRNLKYSDYCEEKSEINVCGLKVKVDDFFAKLLKECANEKEYYVQNGNVANGAKNKFNINMDSEYVLRGKPTLVNNNGLEPIGYPTLQGRMSNICKITGTDITYYKLYRSKIVEEMCLIKSSWKSKEVEKYLKENNLRFKASNILSLIKEVVSADILKKKDAKIDSATRGSISDSKLTVYQENSICRLYKIVAGISMVNQTQKRKLENEHYRLNEWNCDEKELRSLLNELVDVDTMYWEFIVNEGFDSQEQDYLIKIYSSKEKYTEQSEMYYIKYLSGEYKIFNADTDEEIYSNDDCIDIINKIIDNFNEVNAFKRKSIINSFPYDKKEIQRFTPIYLNDIGLDMILALTAVVEFKMAKKAFCISEELEQLNGIHKATPCIDVSTEGEVYIAVLKDNGEFVHLEIEEDKIKVFKSLGKQGRYIECKTIEEMKWYLLEGKCLTETEDEISMVDNKIENLKVKLDEYNEKCDVVLKDEFEKVKNKEYLYYRQREDKEIIVSMYDYDLSVECDVTGEIYIVKKYLPLKGSIERVYEVFKTRDVDEIVKWLSMIKVNNYEDMDYSTFLIG